jgi:mono/diheme cytochrome c family protein
MGEEMMLPFWRVVGVIVGTLYAVTFSWGSDQEVLRPRVPKDQIEAARAVRNPLPVTPEMIEKGNGLFHGKAFCMTCHGRDGKGLGGDIDRSTFQGPLPRDFTDRDWQAARTDGELMWILKNGSPGTAMAVFVGPIITEEEAWHLILYVRSLGKVQ